MKTSLGVVAVLVVVAAVAYWFTRANSTPPSVVLTPASAAPEVMPISHASLVLKWGATTVYADPVGAADAYAAAPRPDIVLVTHEHGDHFNAITLAALMGSSTILVVPQSVADKLPENLKSNLVIMKNNEQRAVGPLNIEAVPSYNLRPDALEFHPKGRDNGYIVSDNTTRVYIPGDTEDTPEMRALQDIDIAFVPMNLPYTMTVEKAADAVLTFRPKQVYPYHYRELAGLGDVARFKALVNATNPNIDVILANWYPQQ